MLTIRAEPGEVLATVDFRQGRIPARTTVCHAFRVRGGRTPFSTDIAAGVSPLITPVKRHHWGHGLVSRDFETVVLLNNVGYKSGDRRARSGTLFIYGGGFERSIPISVEPESVRFVYLRELLGESGRGERPATVSWLLRLDEPGLDAYWVSFASDGRVCGDHA
ncbi:MAG: hypothetical protein JOZ69_17915, partial [Myxococcales bacterium]|nr:hypothetical protein [Myxococcales bacterium]